MKNILIYLVAVSLVFGGTPVFAQEGAVDLPKAGLTPGNPLYFLDRFGEAIREFFTFNPEAKARLQITFAAERISEIKITLETKGVEARGLDVAQARLQRNIAKAASILEDEKQKGKDVSELAKSINDEFKSRKDDLKTTFEEQKDILKAQEQELKSQIRAARLAGDTAQVETLLQQLAEVKAEKELLELKEEEQEEALEAEEERLEEQLEAEERARKAVREAEEEKQEVLEEAAEEGVELPANAFAEFDNLLAEARAAFDGGNFVEARRLAKQAEDSLDDVEELIEQIEEEKEREEERLEEEQEQIEEELERQKEVEEREREREEEEVERPVESKVEEPPQVRNFTIEADDRGFYMNGGDIPSISVNRGEKVVITFKVRLDGVYFNGLDFRGCGDESGGAKPGESAKLEFNAQNNCLIISYWPASNAVKDTLQVIVL